MLSELVTIWPVDQRNHPCEGLPEGVQLPDAPPQLEVMRMQLDGPQLGSANFIATDATASNHYTGAWSVGGEKSIRPDAAKIVGPPGRILLQISGGSSVMSGTLKVELVAGDLASLDVDNWPSSGMLTLPCLVTAALPTCHFLSQ